MVSLAQVNFKMTPENYQDFKRFCARQSLSPYAMLRLVVDCWATGERLIRALEGGQMGKAEVLAELGTLVERVGVLTRANGVFIDAVAKAARHYGVDLPLAPEQAERPGS